jgi:hypothetical protein
MIIEIGEKIHIMYRALYENSTRRHFLGVVQAAEGPVCRLEGFVFIYDQKTTEFIRKPEMRVTIIDISESGYIVNLIDKEVNLDNVSYKYVQGVGLTATDNKSFSLNINEFGSKSKLELSCIKRRSFGRILRCASYTPYSFNVRCNTKESN